MSGTSDAAEALTATPAKTNFILISRLLITGGTRVLRLVLDKIYPPASLATVLSQPAVKADLRRLPEPLQVILYPTPGTYGKSEDFDITILSRLFRAACILPPPPTGWNDEPPPADVSPSGDLVRIRLRRNKIFAHTGEKMEIQDKEFVATWKELKVILIRLAGFVNATVAVEWEKAIDEMQTAPITKEAEIYAEVLKKWYLQDMETKQKLEVLDGKMDAVLTLLSKKDENETDREKQHNVVKEPILLPAKLEDPSLTQREKPEDSSPNLHDLRQEIDINMETTSGTLPAGADSEKDSSEHPSLILHEYQKELAEDALQGKNCIICAPTGSGKTIVASYIAWKHLQGRECREVSQEQACRHKRGRVLFVVDRVHLTSQQQKRFQTFLPKTYTVAKISSQDISETCTLEGRLENYDVTISTAQIVVDSLKCIRVKLSDISLLIIDECHHTDREHPYNQIMSHYLSVKLQPSTSELPQVVGLSASLGVGKSKNISAAKEHIIHICSNVDAQKLTTVQRNKEELKRHSSSPEVLSHKVPKTGYNKFEEAVNRVMGEIEEKVTQYRAVPELKTTDRVQQPYRNWIESACGVAFGNLYLTTYLEHLRQYHITLTIAEVSNMNGSLKYLERYFEQIDERNTNKALRETKKAFEKMREEIMDYVKENGEPLNPKLKKVRELLLRSNEDDGNSRGILFTKTRESTLALEAWIKETEELRQQIRAARIVGTGKGEASQTAAEQKKVIREFENGDVNLLIATTVAEEGLDIPACSYVIRLDMPGNEISTAQSRGRVRTEKGKYDYIASEDSGLIEKEELNMVKEILMVKAVESVQKMNCEDFLTKVKANQMKQIQQRDIKLRKRKLSQSQNLPEDITLFCKKCGTRACQANDFRRLCETHHVVVTKDIMERVKIMPRNKPEQIDNVKMTEKVHCAKCDLDWGVMVSVDGMTPLPCLKIKSFFLKISDGTKKSFKQWSKVPFEVPPLDDDIEIE